MLLRRRGDERIHRADGAADWSVTPNDTPTFQPPELLLELVVLVLCAAFSVTSWVAASRMFRPVRFDPVTVTLPAVASRISVPPAVRLEPCATDWLTFVTFLLDEAPMLTWTWMPSA